MRDVGWWMWDAGAKLKSRMAGSDMGSQMLEIWSKK